MTSTNGNPYYQARTMNGIFNVTDGQYSLAQIGYDTQAIHYENATNTTVIDNTLEATDIIVDTTLTLPSGQVINSATSFLTSTDNVTVTGNWDFTTEVQFPNNQTITPASGNFLLENGNAVVTGTWDFTTEVQFPNNQTITPASGNFLTENANANIGGTWDFTTNITLPNNQNITTGTGYLLVNNVNETVTGDYHFNNTIRFPNNQIVYTTTGDFLLDDIDQTITGNNTFTGNTILGNTTIGSLTVTGNTITGNTTIGELTVTGNTILGDTTIGNLTVINNTILNTVTTNDIICNGDIYFDGEIIKPDPTGKSLGSFVYSSNQLAYQSLFSFDSVIFPSVGDFVSSNTLGIPSGQNGNEIASIDTVNKIISFTPASNLPIATPFLTRDGYNSNTTEIFFYNTFSPTVLGKGIRSSQTTANDPYVNTLFNTDYAKVTTTAIIPQTGIVGNYYIQTGALIISGQSTSTIVSDISSNTYLNKFIEINGFTNNPTVIPSYIFSQDPTNGFVYTMKSRKAIASKISNSTFTGIIDSPTTIFYSSFSPSVPSPPSNYFIEPVTLGTGALLGTTCSAINTGTRTVTVTTQPLVVQELDISNLVGYVNSPTELKLENISGISQYDYVFGTDITTIGTTYILSAPSNNTLSVGMNAPPIPPVTTVAGFIFGTSPTFYFGTTITSSPLITTLTFITGGGSNANGISRVSAILPKREYLLTTASTSAVSSVSVQGVPTHSNKILYNTTVVGTPAVGQFFNGSTSSAFDTDMSSNSILTVASNVITSSISDLKLYTAVGSGFTVFNCYCYFDSTTKIMVNKGQIGSLAIGQIIYPTSLSGTSAISLNNAYISATPVNTSAESSVIVPTATLTTTTAITTTQNGYLRSSTEMVLPSGVVFSAGTMFNSTNATTLVKCATFLTNRVGTTQTYTISSGDMGTSNPTTLQLYITPSLNKAVFTTTPTVGLFVEGSGIIEGTSVSSTVSQYATLSVSQTTGTTPTTNKGAVYLIIGTYYLVYTGSTLTVGDFVIGTGMPEASVIRISTAQPTRTNALTYQTTAPTVANNLLSSDFTCMFYDNWVYIAFTAVVSAFTIPDVTIIFAPTTGTIYDGKIATAYNLESGSAKRIQRFDLVSGLPDTPVTCSGTPTNATGTITVVQFPSSGTGRPFPFPSIGQFYGFGNTPVDNRTSLTVISRNSSAGTITLSASINYTAGTTVRFFDPQYTGIKIFSTNSFSTYTPYNVSLYKNTTISQYGASTLDFIVPKTLNLYPTTNYSRREGTTTFAIKKAKTYDMIPKATGTVYSPVTTSFYNTEDVTYNKLNSITLPDAGGEMVLTTAFQTLTNKILTSPVINTPIITSGVLSNPVMSNPSITTALVLPTTFVAPTVGQLGYSVIASVTTAGYLTTVLVNRGTMTLTAGVWLLNCSISINATSGGATTVQVSIQKSGNDFKNAQTSTLTNGRTLINITVIEIITASTTYDLLASSVLTLTTLVGSGFTQFGAIRIA